MQQSKVIITGGGLAGLYAANRLEALNIPYLLFESKARFFGQHSGLPHCVGQNGSLNAIAPLSNITANHSQDLGPTWIFPHQVRIQTMAKELAVNLLA